MIGGEAERVQAWQVVRDRPAADRARCASLLGFASERGPVAVVCPAGSALVRRARLPRPNVSMRRHLHEPEPVQRQRHDDLASDDAADDARHPDARRPHDPLSRNDWAERFHRTRLPAHRRGSPYPDRWRFRRGMGSAGVVDGPSLSARISSAMRAACAWRDAVFGVLLVPVVWHSAVLKIVAGFPTDAHLRPAFRRKAACSAARAFCSMWNEPRSLNSMLSSTSATSTGSVSSSSSAGTSRSAAAYA